MLSNKTGTADLIFLLFTPASSDGLNGLNMNTSTNVNLKLHMLLYTCTAQSTI